MPGEFQFIEKDVILAGNTAYDEFIANGASEDLAERARTSARESATAHNEVVQAARACGYGSGTATSSSASPDALGVSSPSSTVVQIVQSPMPERYDGIADFEDWLRRYEADARGSGWTMSQMAERLGNYLRGTYFEVWHQHCSKTDFEADRKALLDMFALVRPDEILDKFNSLTWDRSTRVVSFLTMLRRYMTNYNKTLPADHKLSSTHMDKMIMDRMIANAPDGAKSVLRRRQPKTIQEVCEIFEDFKERAPAKSGGPAAAGIALGGTATDDHVSKLIDTFTASQNAMVGSITKLVNQMKDTGGNGFGPNGGRRSQKGKGKKRTPKCYLCSDAHWALSCPFKKHDRGCFICGSSDHMARSCPQYSSFVTAIANKKASGVSGNC
ncbi:hypothetical protein FOZ60_007903 [Perkinsus olseni]|uniref:CCHC-type domain-containing protein n=1 Tax=Perkinsus olseni TaxID=32597 RepID=A0A7J6NKP8_PEROL|nr:hypothetical protein FOZ60_007903 [Perkinsus olseni]